MVATENHDGHKIVKAWTGRLMWEIKGHKSVELWERDVRHRNEFSDELIWHPIVEPPSPEGGAMHSKGWQPEFFEAHGTVVPDGTCMNDTRKYHILMARNVGSFNSKNRSL